MLRRKINQENRKYQWLCLQFWGIGEDHAEKVTSEQDSKEVREAIR